MPDYGSPDWMMPRMLLVAAAISSFTIYRIWIYYDQRRKEDDFAVRMGCEPPRKWAAKWPQGLDLLLGFIQHSKSQTVLQFYSQIVDWSGTTHEQKLPGDRQISTVEPRNLEAILSTQFEDFGLGIRTGVLSPLLGNGIFTQDGAPWKHSRALLRPQFAINRDRNFDEIKKCVESLISKIPADGIIDLQPLFFRLTFDTTTFLLFGETMSSLSNSEFAGEESEFAAAFNLSQDYLFQRARIGPLYWLVDTPGFRRACKTSHLFVDQAIQKSLDAAGTARDKSLIEDTKEPYVFVDTLLRESKDKREIRDQCMNVLLAGRDTTACCLSWTFWLLARHPEVLDKLRTEIETIVGLGRDAPQPTREQLKKMKYLDLVLKEVLRLYPSVPLNAREAVKTTTLPVGGGPDGKSPILVRKGEAVEYCPYVLHRRTDIYGADALEFRPERWEDGKLLREVGYGYLPFNGGPRVCLGQDFALQEAGYTVARLLQRFPSIKLPADEICVELGKEKQTLTLVVAPADGCRVRLEADIQGGLDRMHTCPH